MIRQQNHSWAPLALSLLCASFLGFSCGEGDSGEPQAGTSLSETAMADAEPRSGDPRLAGARKALAAGQASSARTQLDQLGGAAGVEGPLCEARLAFWDREFVAALEAVERARRIAPGDSRVFATAAEILSLTERGIDADDELKLGLSQAGPTPDIRRAQAVRMLTQPGRGPEALKLLEAALEADPSIPYMDWPLSQAYLLTARSDLGQGGAELAIEHALDALTRDPELYDAYVVLGDGYAGKLDFVSALDAYGKAAEAGLDVQRERADTHLRAGMAARMVRDDDAAVAHYLAARELGLSNLEMSSGADFLVARARLALTAAADADIAEEIELAEQYLEEALRLDPHSWDALDYLGNLRFRQRRFNGAAIAWEVLLGYEKEAAVSRESATHLNLGRALVMAGRIAESRTPLLSYLEYWPDGPLAADTREMLQRLSGQ